MFAASSLTDAFTQIGTDFEAANDGTTVTFNFGSSGDLASAIETEGTADVFASASQTYMDDVDAAVGVSRIARTSSRTSWSSSRRPTTRRASPASRISAKPGVQVVLAAEGVPVGDYAREALERRRGSPTPSWRTSCRTKRTTRRSSPRSPRAKADAAIVYVSDVTSAVAPQTSTAVEIPDDVNVIATYPIAVVSASANADLATAFVDYVTGAEGQATLAEFGFLPPPAT